MKRAGSAGPESGGRRKWCVHEEDSWSGVESVVTLPQRGSFRDRCQILAAQNVTSFFSLLTRSTIVTDAVIVAAARTPIGRARKGSLVDVDAFELAQIAVGAVVERSGIATSDIDDIVVAESLQGGGVIARNVAVRLGLTSVPGPCRQPSLRGGPERGADRVSGYPCGHGPRRRRRWHREPQLDAAVFKSQPKADEPAVDVAEPPRRRPTRPRGTCRSPSARTPPGWPGSPAATSTNGRPTTHGQAAGRSTTAASKTRSSRSR